jgi:hypothetical protein
LGRKKAPSFFPQGKKRSKEKGEPLLSLGKEEAPGGHLLFPLGYFSSSSFPQGKKRSFGFFPEGKKD